VHRPQQSTATGLAATDHHVSSLLYTTSSVPSHIASFFQYFSSNTSYNLLHHSLITLYTTLALYQLFPVLHISSHHLPSSLIVRLKGHFTSNFFIYFPSYTSYHLPFSAIFRLTHLITSPPFFSYCLS
jgi:hypothetical protein